MTGESTDARLARIDERIKSVLEELQRAGDGRKQQYTKIEELGRSIMKVENRVENVEKTLSVATPAIDEFMIIKHKVVGAGIVGRWLWGIGGTLLGVAFAMRETILSWLHR